MKKLLLTICLIATTIGYSQITDQNNNQAVGSNGSPLTGNIDVNHNIIMNHGGVILKAPANDAGDVIFRKSDNSQLGRMWTQTNGTSGLYLSSGDNSSDLTIDDSGNVGIGTASPTSKLHVNIGNATEFKTYAHGTEVVVSAGSDPWARSFRIKNQNDDNPNSTVSFGSVNGDAFIATGIDNSSNSTGNPNKKLTVLQNGNVGIGTASPDKKLTVQGDVNIGGTGNANLSVSNNISFSGNKGKLWVSNGFTELQAPSLSDGLSLKTTTSDPITFSTNGSEKMRLIGNGNVGIGTTNPDSPLTVNGKIHCKEVLVDLSIQPDYVFEKYYTGESSLKEDYVMPTLEEVEAYTKENHHLPEVPSAQEVKENGLKLKEMSTILLQKIEELTLYTIEQEKRIKALEAQLATQKQ